MACRWRMIALRIQCRYFSYMRFRTPRRLCPQNREVSRPRASRRFSAITALSLATAALSGGCGPAERSPATVPVSAGINPAASSAGSESASFEGRSFLAAEGTGPALFLDASSSAAPVGYISRGVAFRVAGAQQDGRHPVVIDGPLRVRGWLNADRVGAIARQRGKVEGTAVYLAPGNIVTLLGGEAGETTRVQVAPQILPGMFLGSEIGTFPTENLGLEVAENPEAMSVGDRVRLPAGEEVRVYGRPERGEVIGVLPPVEGGVPATVLRERDGWRGVRIGVGPFLIGYVDAAVTPITGDLGTLMDAAAGELFSEVPQRLLADEDKPLRRILAGARIRFDGRVVGILQEDAFGREMARYDSGEVDVFVAVSDELAIRGMVREAAVAELETGETPAPTPEAPAPAAPTPVADPAAATPAAEPGVAAPVPSAPRLPGN